LAPFDQDVVRLLFGFQEVGVSRHGARDVRVEVVWCRKVGCPALTETADLVRIKREGLWRNHVRNRHVARLARKLREGKWQAIGQDFPAAVTNLRGGNPLSVIVLVENVEHAQALSPYLPGWPLATNSVVKSGWGGQAFKGAGRPVEELTGDKNGVIATAQGIGMLDLRQIDVLVRGDGGVGLPPMTSFPTGKILLRENNLPGTPGGEPRLLLVDFEDRHHPLLRRRGRQRRAAYAGRGWYSPGVDPVQERIDRFLRDRE
jgi:hypothetical protein